MEFRELLNVVVLIVVLQTGLGVVLYSLMSGTPGVSFFSVGLSIIFLVAVSSVIGVILYWLVRRYMKERAIRTAIMTMSDDEQKVLREIMQHKEIRQDDLRKELDFSKSKLSALLNNLEDKNAIKKSRYKRTNLLKPTEQFQQ
ncbi:hypothetical protein AKJ39_01185 [candidate division MSBL1 archaeon SCGC-AAA259J03]|uniref:DUF7343 domain-containing protein n=3 Tax=candidate division MSBL1 TaxID=215777 RepID=A0A133UTW6_9EURY|nr:hypothetical protein AKJ38_00805 [candidate division MSBL1 archaeon SCGC-AAA259I14]KXA98675.1 hypothetical protein AKJ39_01185 [candidate division MSBL1 archaeon SCGC-AAA259J03]